MQSRRYEDVEKQSPIAARVRDRRLDLVHEPYLTRRSPQPRRSLSPRRVEVPRKVLVDNRSTSVERNDYVWDLGPNRAGRMQSRSPPLQKRPHYDDGGLSGELRPPELYRRFETSDYDIGTGYKDDYQYKQRSSNSKVFREEFDGGRLDRMLVQKPMVSEDLAPPGKYVEYGGKLSSPSVNLVLGAGRVKDENIQYPDPLVLNRFSEMDTREKGQKRIFHSRDTSHQFKDFTSTSSGNPRVNYSGTTRIGVPLPSEEQLRSSGKLQQTQTLSAYGQQLDPRHEAELKDLEHHRLDRRHEAELKDLEHHMLDHRHEAELKDLKHHRLDHRNEAELKNLELHRLDRRHEAELKDLTLHRRDTFSPPRAEHRDYLYARSDERERGDYGYPSDEMYRRVALLEQVDYDFDHKEFRRATMVDHRIEQVHNPEFPHRNPSSGNLYDHPYLEHKQVSNHIITSRSSATLRHGTHYLDPVGARVEFRRKIPREQQIQYLGESYDPEVLHMRLDYGMEGDIGLVSRKERIRRSPEFRYETERLGLKTNAVKTEALGMFEQSDRKLKRKYAMVEEMERPDPRTTVSSKWIDSGGTQEPNPQGEEWIDQDDGSGLVLSKRLGYDLNRRTERTFDRADRYRGSTFDDSSKHLQEYSSKTYKPVGRNIKGNSRPVYLNWHNSSQSNKRHVFPKPNNVWVRGKDENQVDQQGIEVEKSELPEDSEDFKELVQRHFLAYTKKLNENAMIRKRYKEDGRAGSLFCIVCGRSMSKEFMDTKRLVNHCFMSHKPGLRTQHLGLQKAVCVLLGWSNVVPTDVTTWTPDIISNADASAQKEDLIIWPPIILIHNTSLPDHRDPQGQPNITIEALEDFLRGKGLGGGRVRFGKPGHHSIMVVKFLGTFSGLQDAEKLRNYFSDNNRGRRDFKQIGSSKGKSKEGGEINGDKVDELLLYGYMGISEDLDRVDFDTKRKCSIKSKKEIQDLVDAPVKPE